MNNNFIDDCQPATYQTLTTRGKLITVKRIDQVHPTVSGNKWYKLKYNLLNAQQLGNTQLLSFGGAYSNHIYALAHAAHHHKSPFGSFSSIGIIRGAELANKPLNPMLARVKSLGMQLEFISREAYRQKHTPKFLSQLQKRYPNAYIIPEGGSNALAVQGCQEILSEQDKQDFDVIVCAVGTGGTIAGLINASSPAQQVIGFAALKGNFLNQSVLPWVNTDKQGKKNWHIYDDDVFGGYHKTNAELMTFIDDMNQQYQLPLEPIYTGKAFYRLLQLLKQGYFSANARILFIHTGGLQVQQLLQPAQQCQSLS